MFNIISHQGSVNQNHERMPIILTNMSIIFKRQVIISVGENVEKLNYPYTAGRNIKWYNHSGELSDTSLDTQHK